MRSYRKILVEVLVVLVLGTVAGLIVRSLRSHWSGHVVSKSAKRERSPLRMEIGRRLKGLDAPHEGTSLVLIAWSPRCKYCAKSETFIKEILLRAEHLKTFAIVIVEKEVDLPAAVEKFGSETPRAVAFRAIDPLELGILGTPTVVLINNGAVSGIWEGEQPPTYQQALLRRLQGADHFLVDAAGKFSECDLGHLRILTEREGWIVLDIRHRQDFDRNRLWLNARHIPLDELLVRARIELPTKPPVILDCSNTPAGQCRVAQQLLAMIGFDRVRFLNLGYLGLSCKVTPFRSNREK